MLKEYSKKSPMKWVKFETLLEFTSVNNAVNAFAVFTYAIGVILILF